MEDPAVTRALNRLGRVLYFEWTLFQFEGKRGGSRKVRLIDQRESDGGGRSQEWRQLNSAALLRPDRNYLLEVKVAVSDESDIFRAESAQFDWDFST